MHLSHFTKKIVSISVWLYMKISAKQPGLKTWILWHQKFDSGPWNVNDDIVKYILVRTYQGIKIKVQHHVFFFFFLHFKVSRVPSVVSCCKFLKPIILKTFNEIVLAFLSVESKINILYVNINFTSYKC